MVKPLHNLVIPNVEKLETNPLKEVLTYLEQIPEDQWFVGSFNNHDHSKYCALGHIELNWPDRQLNGYEFNIGINHRIRNFTRQHYNLGITSAGHGLAEINDGGCPFYQQTTPKQRVIACLRDAIEAGYM